jgi:hypothetical protein
MAGGLTIAAAAIAALYVVGKLPPSGVVAKDDSAETTSFGSRLAGATVAAKPSNEEALYGEEVLASATHAVKGDMAKPAKPASRLDAEEIAVLLKRGQELLGCRRPRLGSGGAAARRRGSRAAGGVGACRHLRPDSAGKASRVRIAGGHLIGAELVREGERIRLGGSGPPAGHVDGSRAIGSSWRARKRSEACGAARRSSEGHKKNRNRIQEGHLLRVITSAPDSKRDPKARAPHEYFLAL